MLESSWNVMTHGEAREGKWRGNRPMEWVASTLHTTSEHDLSSITTADAHTSAASSRLNWRPPADLNGLACFAERQSLVSARVPSHFNWPVPGMSKTFRCWINTYGYFSLDANNLRNKNVVENKTACISFAAFLPNMQTSEKIHSQRCCCKICLRAQTVATFLQSVIYCDVTQ